MKEHMREGQGPAGFISPHLDDVVLSCATAITPGSVVVTVFDSGPAHVDPLPAWDRECAVFRAGDDVPAIRRAEDAEALAQLQASGRQLGFWAQQYRLPSNSLLARLGRRVGVTNAPDEGESTAAVASRLRAAVQESDLSTWFLPLGVAHPDHRRTTDASLQVAREVPELRWIVYEDLPYAAESDLERSAARERIVAAGFQLEELHLVGALGLTRKREAVISYRSQLTGLGDRVETAVKGPERYHALVGAR